MAPWEPYARRTKKNEERVPGACVHLKMSSSVREKGSQQHITALNPYYSQAFAELLLDTNVCSVLF